MDWEKVDLTLEGHIGGEDHPNMPWHMRNRRSALYMDLFATDRQGIIRIVNDFDLDRNLIFQQEQSEFAEESAANNFNEFFGHFPKWCRQLHPWLRGAMAGGDCCDRCMLQMNLLNTVMQTGCCDSCEREMNEEMTANPNVVFAFERGGLRAVA